MGITAGHAFQQHFKFMKSVNREQPGPFIYTRDRETLTGETSVWTPHAKCLLYVGQPPGCLVYMFVRRGQHIVRDPALLGHVCFIFNAWPGT